MTEPEKPLPTELADKKSSSTIVPLVLAGIGAALVWIPFVGYLGALGALWALVERSRNTGGMTAIAVVLGLFGTAGAALWTAIALSSCPHVYAYDGERYHLDGDMLSGALFAGAESEDLVRLEHAREKDGRYRVRIADERDERDFIDRAELLVVDHPGELTPMPTPDGKLPVLRELASPTAALDDHGRDLSSLVSAADGVAWSGEASAHDPETTAEPRVALALTFPRPAGEGPLYLVLRARNTAFATEAFYRYLGRMGPGVGTLLEWAQQSQTYPYRKRLQDELERMEIPLRVELRGAEGWRRAAELGPVGPAALRDVALPLPDPSAKAIEVRLCAPPLFWEIDRAALATSAGEAEVHRLRPSRAVDGRGQAVAPALLEADERRLALAQGDRIDLDFEAPEPASGSTRSVFLSLRGYYEPRIGGRGFLNPVAIYRHHSGGDSLARFVLRAAR
jgi:hypothetical protein